MDETTTQKLKKELCGIVKLYADKGITNAQTLSEVKTALSALSKLYAIEAMERVQAGNYEKGNSDSQPAERYTSSGYHEDGHSGTKEKLLQMLKEAGPEEKEMIRAFINRI